jgi:hypothetical protein
MTSTSRGSSGRPPLTCDAHLNRAGTHVICGGRDDGGHGCPQRLAEWHGRDGDMPRAAITLGEGFFFDAQLRAYRLGEGAQVRLGLKGIAVHPDTGEPLVEDKERYRAGAPARRVSTRHMPTKDELLTAEDTMAFLNVGSEDVVNPPELVMVPCDIICPVCTRRNAVRLDIGRGVR